MLLFVECLRCGYSSYDNIPMRLIECVYICQNDYLLLLFYLQSTTQYTIGYNSVFAGPVPSPHDGKTAEEIAYLDKLNKLQKFVEPLKRIINKIENDNGKPYWDLNRN